MRTALMIALTCALPLAPAYAKNCPPGLAKKDPACVPPGQARKLVDRSELRAGEQLERAADDLRRAMERSSTRTAVEQATRRRDDLSEGDLDTSLAAAQADLSDTLDRLSRGDDAAAAIPVVMLDDLDLPPLPEGERYMVIDNTVIRVNADQYELLDAIRRTAAVASIE